MAAEGTLAAKYEEFCTSLKANPPPWVRAEIDGAAACAPSPLFPWPPFRFRALLRL